MRAGPSAGAAASRGGSGASTHRRCGSEGRESESKRRRCQVFRTRCQVFARMRRSAPPSPGRSPRIGKSLHGFGQIATRFGSMAGLDVAICGISGIRRRKAGDGPPNTEGVGCRVLGCSVAGCRVAVLQGAGLRGRWVAGSLGTELLGCRVAGSLGCWVAGRRVAGCGVAGCGVRCCRIQRRSQNESRPEAFSLLTCVHSMVPPTGIEPVSQP